MLPALTLLAALALPAPLVQDPALARPADAKPPAALHLSSFGSMRAARVGADGSVDSGAAVLQLLDGAGAPLPAANLRFGKGPDLWAEFSTTVNGSDIEVKLLAVPVARGGDERVRVVLRIAAFDRGTEPISFHLVASLRPGGGDPAERPFPSLPFEAGGAWAREGDYITRDDRAVLGWTGLQPEVTVKPAAGGPEDEVARLEWAIDLLPDSARLIEVALAGPPATGVVDEAAFREGFQRWNYLLSEEQLGWQSRFRGKFADIQVHDKRLWYALIGSLHQLRALGDADQEVVAFSDRPFGHPASDAAFDAEAAAVFAEWSFGDWALTFHRKVLDEVLARGEPLSPARRVALVHGLARNIRLGMDAADTEALATAIRTLVDASAEGAPVRPWLDPEQVRADLAAVLAESTPVEGYELPHFAWAEPPQGSVAARFVALRRAVSAHDGAAALAELGPLVAATSVEGFGSMRADGTPDGEWPVGFATVFRDMLVDDHGEDLHLFPALDRALVPARGSVSVPPIPTRFGLLEEEVHYVARTTLGTLFKRLGSREPRSTLWHVPDGFLAAGISKPVGGDATLRPDGVVECYMGPLVTRGLSFNVKPAPDR